MNMYDMYVDEQDFSDHFPICCILNKNSKYGFPTENTHIQENNLTRKLVRFKWKDDLKISFVEQFIDLFRDFIHSVNDDNCMHKRFEFIWLFQCAAENMKVKSDSKVNDKCTSNQPDWWDRDCDNAKRNKYQKLRQFRSTNLDSDFKEYIKSRNIFKNLTRAKRLSLECARRKKLIECRKNPNDFWKCIKKSLPNNNTSDNNIPGHEWKTYFENLFSADHMPNTAEPDIFDDIENREDDSMLDTEISEAEIRQSVNSLRSGCASGIDGVCIEMFKHTIDQTAPYLKLLFNKILNSGEFPNEWSENVITPIHKKGDKNSPNNYRAISLVNSISKIFIKILSERLVKWAENTNVINEAQAGFRSGYSTVDNIFNLQAIIQKYTSKRRGRFYVFFIDFLKAFDNCIHTKLWESLSRKGINQNGKFLKVFKSMYSQLKSCVKVGNYLTESFICEKGTKQGCVSSTIIFSLYINDLIVYLKSVRRSGITITGYDEDVHGFLFADDVAILGDTVVNLQRAINDVETFCKSTGMQLNIDKSEIIIFRNGGPTRSNESWIYNDQRIQITNMYKYLGVYFTPKLIWTKTKEIMCQQALKSVNCIFSRQKYFGYFTINEAFKLFDSMVSPILTYAADIWGYQYSQQIEQIHVYFCKRVACLNQNVANFFALSECGRYPLSVLYMSKCIKYWCKLTHMSETRYPKRCYNMLRRLDELGRITWATHVKQLLFQYGFGYVWIYGDVGDINMFMQQFTSRLKDCCKQNLHENINTSPKALSYKLFKTNLTPETYLSISLSYIYKKILSNFRCSGHRLMIERGRHLNIDREFRFCEFCLERNVYSVEDEFHYLLVCPKLNALRHKCFLQQWLDCVPSERLFIRIMSDTTPKGIYALCRYLKHSASYA
jgi:hypothetical protein